MKRLLLSRVAVVAALSGLLVGFGIGTAQALSVNGASGVFYANPYNYLNYANINDADNRARTYIRRESSANIGANRVGAQARLFRSDNNNLCTASSYTVNSSTVTLYAQSTNTSYCGHIGHYSLGLTKANAGGSTWIQYATYIAGPLTF